MDIKELLPFGALGAPGILLIVLYYGLRMLNRIADRFVESFDKLDQSLDKVGDGVHGFELAAERRHQEIQAAAVRNNDAIRQLLVALERQHGEVLVAVRDTAAATRHEFRNVFQRFKLEEIAAKRGIQLPPPAEDTDVPVR